MQKSQKGFTLIELVVVIVLLGILGVTALGKFQDLSTDAQTAANSAVASEITAGATINYAARLLDNTAGVDLSANGIDCATLANGAAATSLLTTALPITQFTVSGTANCATATPGGTDTNCSVIGAGTPTGASAPIAIICTN